MSELPALIVTLSSYRNNIVLELKIQFGGILKSFKSLLNLQLLYLSGDGTITVQDKAWHVQFRAQMSACL